VAAATAGRCGARPFPAGDFPWQRARCAPGSMLLKIGVVEAIAVAVVKRNSGFVFKNPSLLFKLLLAGASFELSSFNAVLWAAWSRNEGRRKALAMQLDERACGLFSGFVERVRLVGVFTLTGLCRSCS
jgi:hypothetical protein